MSEDCIAYRNRDIYYFSSGQCKNPYDILRVVVNCNDIELLDIIYKSYTLDFQQIMEYAIQMDKKDIVTYLHERNVKFSDEAIILTTMNGNKEMLEWCLNQTTVRPENMGEFANALFKSEMDILEKSKLKSLIDDLFI